MQILNKKVVVHLEKITIIEKYKIIIINLIYKSNE